MYIKNHEKYSEIISSVSDLRNYLGEEVFTVTKSTLEENSKSIIDIEKTVSKLSSLNSTITELIIESKADRLEENIARKIRQISQEVASLQYSLMKILTKRKEWIKLIEEISDLGIEFANHIMDTQDLTREIITDFKSQGYKVPESDLSRLMDLSVP